MKSVELGGKILLIVGRLKIFGKIGSRMTMVILAS